jgi:carbon-monoxide dehydrogenase medium subunit
MLADAPDGVALAGGQTLIPTLRQRLAAPTDVIDLSRVPGLNGVRMEGGQAVIRAMTTHDAVAHSSQLRVRLPALTMLAARIGDPQVRNLGTIGGSVANNDPAADYPAALLGLGARIRTTRREIAAEDFFTGMFETALAHDELATEIVFPMPERAGYAKFPQTASRFALVGVFVSRGAGGVRVAVTGAGPCVFQVEDLETALAGDFKPEAIEGITVPADGLTSDLHGAADYRAHLIGVLARRAVAAALSWRRSAV